jgi:uncharacterized membrane protein
MGIRRSSLVVACLITLFVAAPALAGTGGRAGGGSWGKSSPSSSSSSRSYSSSPSRSSYSSSSSSSGGSYRSSYSGGGGGGGSATGLGLAIGLLIIIGIPAFLIMRAMNSGPSNNYTTFMPSYTPAENDGGVDVSVLRVAIDGRARRYVQNELARIAKVADTSTDEGRLLLLREVSLMLRKVRDAWVYGGATNEPMRGADAAKACFDRHVDNARMKINMETISNVQGVVQTQHAPNYTPRSEEGEGVILVTLVVAALSELFTVQHIGDGEDLRKAIESSAHRSAHDLVAVEIIWMPSEDNDRMSSIELEAKYPHPELIKITGALVGKTFCAYCSGPFPAELVSCPHCGAPAPGREQASPRAA